VIRPIRPIRPLIPRSGNGKSSFYWPGGTQANPDFVWAWDHYRYPAWAPLP
jgi:hypothetical protein